MNKVYIVLVNYKKYKDTIECLESIVKNSYLNYTVLIVDNSPDDTSYLNIKEWLNGEYTDNVDTLFPDLVYPLNIHQLYYQEVNENDLQKSRIKYNATFILTKTDNRGFAAANNVALNYIINNGDKNSFIWILNNDTVIDKNALPHLVAFYTNQANHDKLIGGKLMHYYKKEFIQAIAADYNKFIAATHHIGDHELDKGQYDNYHLNPTNYIVGASMFLPIAYLEKIGLLNEEYFLFYEELDWKERASKLNLLFDVEPKAIIYHKEGGTIKGGVDNKNMDTGDYYSIISRIKFTKKWHPACLPIVGLGVSYALFKRTLQGRHKLVWKIIKDIFALLVV